MDQRRHTSVDGEGAREKQLIGSLGEVRAQIAEHESAADPRLDMRTGLLR